jgi:hypothetical protein
MANTISVLMAACAGADWRTAKKNAATTKTPRIPNFTVFITIFPILPQISEMTCLGFYASFIPRYF